MSVDAVTAQMATTSLDNTETAAAETKPINASQNEAVIASAAEGRRLYIGNLAYATTEGELKEFFKDYLVSVHTAPSCCPPHH
jgi:RNA recognition motif-containing protein